MLLEMIYNYAFWINNFPTKGGVSSKVSPLKLINGIKIDYNPHWKI